MVEGGLLEVYRDVRGLRVLSFDGNAEEAIALAGSVAGAGRRDPDRTQPVRRRRRFRLQRRPAVIVVVTTQV